MQDLLPLNNSIMSLISSNPHQTPKDSSNKSSTKKQDWNDFHETTSDQNDPLSLNEYVSKSNNVNTLNEWIVYQSTNKFSINNIQGLLLSLILVTSLSVYTSMLNQMNKRKSLNTLIINVIY